jgi:hypothetical protein
MKENKKMEVFGNLTKYDTVVAIDEKIVPGSLVFDSLNPFPGYYHETPMDGRPIYIYLVLDKQYPLEDVLRATQNIEEEYKWKFNAGKGYMRIGSQFLNVIRVRHLPELDLVEKIQEAYVKNGINFLMNKKIKGKIEAEVKIVKFLSLNQLGEGIYIDLNEPMFGYIEIPRYLHHEAFVKVSMDVKYNWLGHEYDAAAGSFYKDGKLYELVRILSNKIDKDYLADIRKLYLDKIRM